MVAAFAAVPIETRRAAAETRLDDGARRVVDWRGGAAVQALHRRLAALDACLPPDSQGFVAALEPWIRDSGWYRSMLATALDAMADDPVAALPWRMQPGRLVQGIALVEQGGGSAMLSVVSADTLAHVAAAPQRLVFDCGYSLVMPVAGSLEIERWCLDQGKGTVALADVRVVGPGDVMACANRTEQMQLRSAPCDAVVLTMAVAGPGRSEPALEFDARSGTLLRHGVADPVVSRMLALLDLLSAAEAQERRALLALLCSDSDPLLRWQAMRRWLADDLHAALPQLAAMAETDRDAAVRRAAAAALDMLQPWREERGDAG